jgi:DNA adenine methylase
MPVHPIISRVGGKSKIAKKIIEMIPEHKTYVEPFVGGGSIFFKKPEAEVNVINDKDKDIYNIYKDITRVASIEDFDMGHPSDKEEFFKYLNQTKFKNPKERLYRNIYLSKRSFSGNRTSPAIILRPSGGIVKLKKNYNDIRDKLKKTIILNEDYKKVIEKYDSPDTFIYLDPPYSQLNPKWGYTENAITPEQLLEVLKNIKGKFLMTYDYNKKNVDLFSQFFKVKTIDQIYELSGKRTKAQELIVTNY